LLSPSPLSEDPVCLGMISTSCSPFCTSFEPSPLPRRSSFIRFSNQLTSLPDVINTSRPTSFFISHQRRGRLTPPPFYFVSRIVSGSSPFHPYEVVPSFPPPFVDTTSPSFSLPILPRFFPHRIFLPFSPVSSGVVASIISSVRNQCPPPPCCFWV